MPNTMLILLTLFCVLSFSLAAILLVLLWKMIKQNQNQSNRNRQFLVNLLRDERRTSQSLLNQLRSPDVGTLMGMQQATMEDRSSDPVNVDDNFPFDDPDEGYAIGALDNDLESQGWSAPLIRKDPDGDPVAYER